MAAHLSAEVGPVRQSHPSGRSSLMHEEDLMRMTELLPDYGLFFPETVQIA